MKIEQVELMETEYKTKRKFQKTGTLRLETIMINADMKSAWDVLDTICQKVDCNFHEVLDAINRTVR